MKVKCKRCDNVIDINFKTIRTNLMNINHEIQKGTEYKINQINILLIIDEIMACCDNPNYYAE